MDDNRWLPLRIAAGLPVDVMAVAHIQETMRVWLDLRI